MGLTRGNCEWIFICFYQPLLYPCYLINYCFQDDTTSRQREVDIFLWFIIIVTNQVLKIYHSGIFTRTQPAKYEKNVGNTAKDVVLLFYSLYLANQMLLKSYYMSSYIQLTNNWRDYQYHVNFHYIDTSLKLD